MLSHFEHVFQKFALPDPEAEAAAAAATARTGAIHDDGNSSDDMDMDMDDDEYEQTTTSLSNRAKKDRARLTVAQLKQLVAHPDVVEDHDVTAADSRLLVHLKSFKGTVPVPRHWMQKRKYLQGKSGHEQSQYELPASVLATGIDKVREAIKDEEDEKTTKQRQRERTRPKMGKINVDYQALYDAFFLHMQRPQLTSHGDIYYEGKEDEYGGGGDLGGKSKFVPGLMSTKLQIALGLVTEPEPEVEGDKKSQWVEKTKTVPPPWLFNMQRYGPPPSYPRQKIAGLNAPIPMGAEFGYHIGGWGKPPVDEQGRPLYGDDVFDQNDEDGSDKRKLWKPFSRAKWGELQATVEEEEEEEEEDEDILAAEASQRKEEEAAAAAAAAAAAEAEESEGEDMEESDDDDDSTFDVGKTNLVVEKPKQLYTVLHQQAVTAGGSGTNFLVFFLFFSLFFSCFHSNAMCSCFLHAIQYTL